MRLLNDGKPLSTAAAQAGMSEPTARKYRRQKKLPSEGKGPRRWRTRVDPFAAVWDEVEQWLTLDAGLEAKTVFEELQRRYDGRFASGQLRTLQRRLRSWRALKGPAQEVYFAQQRRAGEQCQSDFTDMNALAVTIGGVPYRHLCYHFVLPYSNWEWARLAPSESFEALTEGLQASLWELGGVPSEHRTDNLSAATHELRRSRGRGFNERYREVLSYYGLRASTNHPGRAHENGDVESAHHQFKRAVDQRLRLRGSREFASVEDYASFLQALLLERNRLRAERLNEERAVLHALPARPLPCCRESFATVSRFSLVRVAGKPYSVPSRLCGERLRVRLFATRLELHYQDTLVGSYPRLTRDEAYRIDYRHLIHSLIKKPGAFARYVYREALFPSLTFRRAYDALCAYTPEQADLEYLRILYLAATTLETTVEAALTALLERDAVPGYAQVQAAVAAPRPPCPVLELAPPELAAYDALLEVAA
jgi:hypothetical protein